MSLVGWKAASRSPHRLTPRPRQMPPADIHDRSGARVIPLIQLIGGAVASTATIIMALVWFAFWLTERIDIVASQGFARADRVEAHVGELKEAVGIVQVQLERMDRDYASLAEALQRLERELSDLRYNVQRNTAHRQRQEQVP